MVRISTLIWLFLSVLTGTTLYNISQISKKETDAIRRLDHKIAYEKNTLDVLNAEWSYLNRPSRLRQLAEKHLSLSEDDTQKLARIDILPDRTEPEKPEQAPSYVTTNVIPSAEDSTKDGVILAKKPSLRPRFARPVIVKNQIDVLSPQIHHKTVEQAPSFITPHKGFNDVLKGLGLSDAKDDIIR